MTIESQSKRQIISLTRLQAYGEAMGQLIEGSIAFGPILERVKVNFPLEKFVVFFILNN